MTEGERPEVVVITGMSGAGRSTAIHVFEDQGYFCIDNLPPTMIAEIAQQAMRPGAHIDDVAVVCDVRGKMFFDELTDAIDELEEEGYRLRLLFLEAEDRVLVQRFKETRRPHPLAEDGSIVEGIERERKVLRDLRGRADLVVDTGDMLPRRLREVILEDFLRVEGEDVLNVNVTSFGYKYGLPLDADVVIDCRFIPNPYYDPGLRPLTGLDRPVSDWVLARPEAKDFLERWSELLLILAPRYHEQDKSYLSVAFGCTGGMHRSVVLAERTSEALRDAGYRVTVHHRDIEKDTTRGLEDAE